MKHPVFVILLKRSLERCEHVYNVLVPQLNDENFDLHIFDAIDGTQKDESVAFGANLLPGQIGCALSHVHIWRKIADSFPYGIVLEDDAVIVDPINFWGQINKILNELPEQWDFVYLYVHKVYTSSQKDKRNGIENKTHIIKGFPTYGLAGYLISQNGAKVLLEQNTSLHVPIDINLMNIQPNRVFFCVTENVVDCVGQANNVYQGEKLRSNIYQ